MNKYRNVKCECDGFKFDSIAERSRYIYLKKCQELEEISGLELQKSFELIPAQTLSTGKKIQKTCYLADFYYLKDLEPVVEDVKGVLTDVYRLKKKLMLYVHGIEISEIQ
jgi:hypothetical protein